MRNNGSYRRFYSRIRRATDTRAIGELMKQANEARQDGSLSIKHFIALNTATDNQRERLLSAPLSATAYKLIDEIVAASEKKLGYLGWAMYGDNNPSHPIHKLNSCEQTRAWEIWNGCKEREPSARWRDHKRRRAEGSRFTIIVDGRKRLLANPPCIPHNPARPELRLSLAAPIMCSSFYL